MVGPEGVEPSRRKAQEPKSCVSANSTTGPKDGVVYHKEVPAGAWNPATRQRRKRHLRLRRKATNGIADHGTAAYASSRERIRRPAQLV